MNRHTVTLNPKREGGGKETKEKSEAIEKKLTEGTEVENILKLIDLLLSEYKFLQVSDISELDVETSIDCGFIVGKKQAWTLTLKLTTGGIEKTQKAGFKFREYTKQLPEGTYFAQIRYSGQ